MLLAQSSGSLVSMNAVGRQVSAHTAHGAAVCYARHVLAMFGGGTSGRFQGALSRRCHFAFSRFTCLPSAVSHAQQALAISRAEAASSTSARSAIPTPSAEVRIEDHRDRGADRTDSIPLASERHLRVDGSRRGIRSERGRGATCIVDQCQCRKSAKNC